MTKNKDWEYLHLLTEKFPADEVKERPGAGGKMLSYLERASYENRLDAVVGMANWQTRYEFGPNGEIVCYVSIRVEGDWIWKADGAEQTNIESVKGGLTDSFKRACARWGIGRYLYTGGEVKNRVKRWKPVQTDNVIMHTNIETHDRAERFLDNSGLPHTATVDAIRDFAMAYDAEIKDGKTEAEAYKFAKEQING